MMRHLTNQIPLITLMMLSLVVGSCSEDDDPLSTLGVAFETTALGISPDDNSVEAVISFSRATSVQNTITLNIEENGVQYDVEYETNPAASENTIQITVPAGAETASFTVTRIVNLIGQENSVTFTLAAVNGQEESQISGNTSITVSFQAIASADGSLVAGVGGATQPNQVFVDFSLNNQTSAERVSWDLGFYSGSDDKVIVNYSTFTMARQLDKIDLNSVTAEDTVGFAGVVTVGTTGAHIYVDDPDRDLNKLAIADISATDAENKVYIINRGGGPGTGSNPVATTPRGWKKIRILKNGDDYVIQHADIAATSFAETTISKDENFNFIYFSFENGGNITVEPEKASWDIVFTVSSNIIDFGDGDGAYGFSDFILSNRQGGVEIARSFDLGPESTLFTPQFINNDIAYDDFTMNDVAGLTFSSDGNTIGSIWRSVFSGVYPDIFFIVKDPEGNHYKVQFLDMFDENGERGHPQLQYELL